MKNTSQELSESKKSIEPSKQDFPAESTEKKHGGRKEETDSRRNHPHAHLQEAEEVTTWITIHGNTSCITGHQDEQPHFLKDQLDTHDFI